MKKTVKISISLLLAALICSAFFFSKKDEKTQEELRKKIQKAEQQTATFSKGIADIVSYTKDHYSEKPENTDGLLLRNQREDLRQVWASLTDYYIASDVVREEFDHFINKPKRPLRRGSFMINYRLFLAQYKGALEFIETIEKDERRAVLLNEALEQQGIAAGAYNSFKFRFLNVGRAVEFAAFHSVYQVYKKELPETIQQEVESASDYLFKMGKGKGELMTVKNGLNIIKSTGKNAWLPVQQGIAESMGNIKVKRRGVSLISHEIIQKELHPLLQPGDILVERREWYLSNVGIPGYWTHVAFYIGSPEERRAYFDDEETRNWIKTRTGTETDFESFLKQQFPERYPIASNPLEDGFPCRVIEAIGEGVSFTSLEHSAASDSCGALRPKLSKLEKAIAIYRAFQYQGRPYDFNFDFETDSEFVCSELVYKAYEKSPITNGLSLPLKSVAGRFVCPPNDIVEQFEQNMNTADSQFTFAAFLDGYEKSRTAVRKTAEEFAVTHKRPKWHIIIKEFQEKETD